MKKLNLIATVLMLLLLTVGCTGTENQDLIGRYSNKAEDSKEKIEESFSKLQEVAEGVQKNVPNN